MELPEDVDLRAELAQRRPDRYEAGDETWYEDLVDLVAPTVSVEAARAEVARNRLRSIEKTDTRRANKLLREIHLSGAWPLDWMDYTSAPLAIDGKNRVRLDRCTADDLERFANRELLDAARDHGKRVAAAEGALETAREMRAAGASSITELNHH